ncbi:hypothetical protein K435DRAFT_866461 [Dendrothele bispora CBS 962.96]|uniref:Uncharacterized protein n=1 Tax=Dendrothele bispora (strain CBS 962.96) TaxID=1314807 RepID=A0A4S8LI67_DENBC|nr:hypothetical protein K435DRAFT_866461 [Dendrothele bispora CBS 962.96]
MDEDKQPQLLKGYNVIVDPADGSVRCGGCEHWRQTGKTCIHVAAYGLLEKFGPASDYIAREVIRSKRGLNSKGVISIPSNPRIGAKKRPLKRHDYHVDKDYDAHLNSMLSENPFSGDEDTSVAGSEQEITTGVSRGRPPATKPLHPGRTKQSESHKIAITTKVGLLPKAKKIVQFSAKPGPKSERLGPLSLQKLGPQKVRAKQAMDRTQGIKILNSMRQRNDIHKQKALMDVETRTHSTVNSVFQNFSGGAEPDLPLDMDVESHFHQYGTADRWMSLPSYWLRQDEADGILDFIMAIIHARSERTIVLNGGPACSTGRAIREAGVYRTADELANIKPLIFGKSDSFYGRTHWYTRQLVPDVWRFVLYDWARRHWVMVELHINPTYKVVVIDSLSSGSVDDFYDWDDVLTDIIALAAHFTHNLTFAQAVQRWKKNKVEYRALSVQDDGWACGFWTCCFALLAGCGIETKKDYGRPHSICSALITLGIQKLKYHLIQIYNSFVLSENGLKTLH